MSSGRLPHGRGQPSTRANHRGEIAQAQVAEPSHSSVGASGGTRVAVPPSKEKSVDVGPSVSPSFEKSTGVSPYIGRELVRGSESAGRLGIDE